MPDKPVGGLHAYLVGLGRDGRGRRVTEVLNFSNEELEYTHDFIQWLFPLRTRSGAQPNAPILTPSEIDAIRSDPRAVGAIRQAADRMLRFYCETDSWLSVQDHNHLRITRILHSLRLLIGLEAAQRFRADILFLHEAAGRPINARSLRFWEEAMLNP